MPQLTIQTVTNRIIERSRARRELYLIRRRDNAVRGAHRLQLGCSNLAHGFAACGAGDKKDLAAGSKPNLAIVSAYNDMLSAHQPYEHYPAIIRDEAHKCGAVAQFAGGVPAMCDGVTQGTPGMELSLFSRDVIALSTAIALSHNMFDAVLCLGICDKIVPGLIMGALQFSHLPVVFVPGGPMPSGLPNKEKARMREEYAAGRVGEDALLEAESNSYHSPGTCTFYGTANTNQMMVELMGLQLPGSSFVNPGTRLREALTREAVKRAVQQTSLAGNYAPMYEIVDERAIVNAIVGLNATGGSTNHTLHLVAIARAAGILIDWSDMAEISSVVPLLCRIYPNGEADVNHFQHAGGMAFLTRELLEHGLLHEDVQTIAGYGLRAYTKTPVLNGDRIVWEESPRESGDKNVLAPVSEPFAQEGGIVLMEGNLGRAIFKSSAVKPEHRVVEAPARIFRSQQEFKAAFERNELGGDFIAVITHQGPHANGMPELHKLVPPLAVLQRLGQKVALVTDGRMSGASGKVPAAIHVTPEARCGGPLAKLRDGDIVRFDGLTGRLEVKIDPGEWAAREAIAITASSDHHGMGRELFAVARNSVSSAEEGASFALMEDVT